MGIKTDMLIRKVGLADYEILIRFLDDNNISEIVRYFHPFPFTSETARNIIYKTKQDKYYVALFDDRIVGLSMLRGWDEGFDIPSFGVLVDRSFHNQGIGMKLTQFSLTEAKNLGCKKIRLSVYASNVNALHIYSSLGFKEKSCTVIIVNGKPDTKIIMVKELE